MEPPRLQPPRTTFKTKIMSLSTIKRSVVWIDNERKAAKEARKAKFQSRDRLWPSPWIDLRSEASTAGYDGDSLTSIDNYTYISESASYFTPPLTFERSAGYDNGRPMYFEPTYEKDNDDGKSVTEKSITSNESHVIYPGAIRLALITLSIALSLFLISLDRTIVSTAM